MGLDYTPNAVTIDAVKAISEYCANRHYKCKGCRYSIKYIMPDYDGYADCVFANCPCDWEIPKESTVSIVDNEKRVHVLTI